MVRREVIFCRWKLLPTLALLLLFPLFALHSPCFAGSPVDNGCTNEQKLLFDREYYPELLHRIETARQEIVIVAYLFKTTKARSNRPAAIVRKLIAARRRGVDVSIVLEMSDYDQELNRENRKVAELLQRNDITVRFDSRKKTTHAKLAVIDRRFVLLGSHNLTNSALAANHEVSILIDDRAMAAKILGYIKTL